MQHDPARWQGGVQWLCAEQLITKESDFEFLNQISKVLHPLEGIIKWNTAEAGVIFMDIAEFYHEGWSEELLGQAIRDMRIPS